MELEKISKRYLEIQAVPISGPDPRLRRQILQRKSHGKADARGLTGAEIAARQLNACERAEKAYEQLEGESQGGTSITVAIRSPERLPPASTAPPRLQEASPEERNGSGQRLRLRSRCPEAWHSPHTTPIVHLIGVHLTAYIF